MMKPNDFKFIELPKSDTLSAEEQAFLLGKGYCETFTTCPRKYESVCEGYSTGNCSATGACSGDLHCGTHTCADYNF